MECFFGRRRTHSGNLTECVNVLIISPNGRVFGVDPPMGTTSRATDGSNIMEVSYTGVVVTQSGSQYDRSCRTASRNDSGRHP